MKCSVVRPRWSIFRSLFDLYYKGRVWLYKISEGGGVIVTFEGRAQKRSYCIGFGDSENVN